MKKKLCLTMAALLTASLVLGGCGKQESASTEGDVAVISLWTNNSHSKSVVTEEVNKWNETVGKEKGIKIEYVVKGDDYANQLALADNADNLPDIFLQGTAKMAEEGKLVALSDYPEAADFLAEYGDEYLKPTNILFKDDKYYTVTKDTVTYGLVYNKDMFRAAGIVDENGEPTPPKTYEEMVEYAKRLTNPEKKEYGIIFPVKWSGWTTTDIVYPALVSGGRNSGYDRKTGTFDYKDIAPIMKAIMQIKHDGSCYPGGEMLDNDPARAQFSEGRIGMKFSGSYDVSVFINQFPAKCDWGVAPYPSEKADVRYMGPSIYSNGGYISKKAVERVGFEKVFEVYKWFNSKELARTRYLAGMDLPYKFELVADIADQCEVNGWKEFAEISQQAHNVPANLPSKPEGFSGRPIQVLCSTEFWYEKSDIDTTLAEYTKACNEGIQPFLDENPDYDVNDYVDPEWDISIK